MFEGTYTYIEFLMYLYIDKVLQRTPLNALESGLKIPWQINTAFPSWKNKLKNGWRRLISLACLGNISAGSTNTDVASHHVQSAFNISWRNGEEVQEVPSKMFGNTPEFYIFRSLHKVGSAPQSWKSLKSPSADCLWHIGTRNTNLSGRQEEGQDLAGSRPPTLQLPG